MQYSDTPFHEASEFGHLAVVKLLLDRAVDVNARNSVSIDAWLLASTPLETRGQRYIDVVGDSRRKTFKIKRRH